MMLAMKFEPMLARVAGRLATKETSYVRDKMRPIKHGPAEIDVDVAYCIIDPAAMLDLFPAFPHQHWAYPRLVQLPMGSGNIGKAKTCAGANPSIIIVR